MTNVPSLLFFESLGFLFLNGNSGNETHDCVWFFCVEAHPNLLDLPLFLYLFCESLSCQVQWVFVICCPLRIDGSGGSAEPIAVMCAQSGEGSRQFSDWDVVYTP